MNPRRDMSDPGAQWLADGHPRPDQVWGEWNDDRAVALLPAGVRWDAVVMPQARLQAVVEDMSPLVADRCPILADLNSARAYILVPPGTADTWGDVCTEGGISVTGEGSWLIASRPLGRQSRAATWLIAPGAVHRLANPAELLASLRRTAAPAKGPTAAPPCATPCPDPAHQHTCARGPFHCGIPRDATENGAESCSWTRRSPL
ncbi:hypothetical protein ACIQKB_37830 [Streptomyces sp. NPDC092046]|uniref:hypothetical protein n=1 Tax=Streptomyces sp. NPDC092046 TaxID=3366009 RepID=UPI0038261C57